MPKRAIVLLSGGLDSTTCLAKAASEGFTTLALTVNYGQRHRAELDAARRVAAHYRCERHEEVTLDLRRFGGSALTSDMEVPKERSLRDIAAGIPITYVPARNTIMLSLALAWAETANAPNIFIGVNALDYSGYPDCRPEYIRQFERLANLATRQGVEGSEPIRIHTPLMRLTKAEIIRLGTSLGVDYGMTLTCYDPDVDGRACGRCDACLLRLKGFREADARDPAPYAVGR